MNQKHYLIIYCSILVWLILSSCGTVKEELAGLPPEDSSAVLYFRNGVLPDDGGKYVSMTIQEEMAHPVMNETNDSFLDWDTESNIAPSLSPDGKYLAMFPGKTERKRIVPYSKEQQFTIYDANTNAEVYHGKTKVSCTTTIHAPYEIPWSSFGHDFYIVNSDTIKKCSINGKEQKLAVIDNLTNFSVSPSERWLVFSQNERVGFINLQTGEMVRLKDFESILGIQISRCVKVFSWSPDESKLAFAEGQRITIYDIAKQQNEGYKVGADVYDIEWLSNNKFLYVQGFQAADNAHNRQEPFFEIDTYSLTTKKDTMLHHHAEHEPLTVKPKLSPSGNVLLFSERGNSGTYHVMLMSVDGMNISTLCEGYSPFWKR